MFRIFLGSLHCAAYWGEPHFRQKGEVRIFRGQNKERYYLGSFYKQFFTVCLRWVLACWHAFRVVFVFLLGFVSYPEICSGSLIVVILRPDFFSYPDRYLWRRKSGVGGGAHRRGEDGQIPGGDWVLSYPLLITAVPSMRVSCWDIHGWGSSFLYKAHLACRCSHYKEPPSCVSCSCACGILFLPFCIWIEWIFRFFLCWKVFRCCDKELGRTVLLGRCTGQVWR